jgi:peptidoglycan/LPS O-acetylase OafA/YrhL
MDGTVVIALVGGWISGLASVGLAFLLLAGSALRAHGPKADNAWMLLVLPLVAIACVVAAVVQAGAGEHGRALLWGIAPVILAVVALLPLAMGWDN